MLRWRFKALTVSKAVIIRRAPLFLMGAFLFTAVLLNPGNSDLTTAQSVPVFHGPKLNKISLKPHLDPNKLFLRSEVALVMEQDRGTKLLAKSIDTPRPIASLTKLMTAMVTLDAGLPLDESITITRKDRDRYRGSKSKLSFGTRLTRHDLLKISLASSENRAARALARTYPGGTKGFVAAMNDKARQLGLENTRFQDAAGLRSENISTASDLAVLVGAAYDYELIREFSTTPMGFVTDLRSGWKVEFLNTNRLVRSSRWNIGLSKTGYLADAGNCLVMQADIADRSVVIVLLNSWGKMSKFGDANRIKAWLERADRKARENERANEILLRKTTSRS